MVLRAASYKDRLAAAVAAPPVVGRDRFVEFEREIIKFGEDEKELRLLAESVFEVLGREEVELEEVRKSFNQELAVLLKLQSAVEAKSLLINAMVDAERSADEVTNQVLRLRKLVHDELGGAWRGLLNLKKARLGARGEVSKQQYLDAFASISAYLDSCQSKGGNLDKNIGWAKGKLDVASAKVRAVLTAARKQNVDLSALEEVQDRDAKLIATLIDQEEATGLQLQNVQERLTRMFDSFSRAEAEIDRVLP